MRLKTRSACIVAVAVIGLSSFGWAGQKQSKKGDFVVNAGWAATGGQEVHDNGIVAGVEYMLSDAWSMRLDYARASSVVDDPVSSSTTSGPPISAPPPPEPPVCHPVGHCDPGHDDPPPGHDPPGKGFALTVAPHWKALSFPVGLIGFDLPDRKDPAWASTAGVWADYWKTETVGIGGGASYRFTENTDLAGGVYDVRAGIEFRF